MGAGAEVLAKGEVMERENWEVVLIIVYIDRLRGVSLDGSVATLLSSSLVSFEKHTANQLQLLLWQVSCRSALCL